MTPPTLFNVTVDSVVRNWLSMTVGDNAVIHDGLGHAVGRILGVFYEEDGILGSQYLEWIQGSLNVLIGLLLQIDLMANVTKSKTMTHQPGAIWSGMLKEEVGRKSTGKGATYQERLQRCLLLPYYGVDLMARSMMDHFRNLNGTETEIDWDRILTSQAEHLPQVHEVIYPRVTNKCKCPFPGFPGSSKTRISLRNHFNRQKY